MQAGDLQAAADTVALASDVVERASSRLAAAGGPDERQVFGYDLAHAAAAVETARSALEYGSHGKLEREIACAFVADAVHDLMGRALGREESWGLAPGQLGSAGPFVSIHRDPAFLAPLGGQEAPRHLDPDFELVRDSFRRFAEDRIAPVAEAIHRENADIPEEIITGLAEMGSFGLSVPEEYGGFASGGDNDYLGMVVATEELSRSSLGAGGSLITRPEILARALLKGGTEQQKSTWLPKLASGEVMAAVAVTEPDFGSDVAAISVSAVPREDGWAISGTKTWSTFAARAEVLMLLARTDPDRSLAHRGLSLFIVPKPRSASAGFTLAQSEPSHRGGRLEGRPIDTIGYRGMHSYELSFDDWWVPAECLIGEDSGLGKGFYLQMQGFENGRLQTAARAVGVMQAAYEAAVHYAENRTIFGTREIDFELTRVKLARMAVLIQVSRQASYKVAKLMSKGEGTLEASMIKAYVCRAAEWVTREAMQLHGGMGYAEEFPVSRYFVDARVLSIFEGADETLALKVIARRLADRASGPAR